jgi:hypothetical protein
VVGLFPDEQPTAVLVDRLLEAGPATLQGPAGPVVVWVTDTVSSALDSGAVASGRQIPAVAAYRARAGGQELSFATADGGFVDRETGSTWDVTGTAVAGPLQGEALQPVPAVTTFWFAWAAFQPDTDVVG